MSVTGNYWRLTGEEWSRLKPYLAAQPGTEFWREGEQAFVDLISAEWMAGDCYLDLQQDWHLIHCLLTDRWERPGEITPAPPPRGNAVRGGTDTPFEAQDGMTRSRSPSEVKEVANAPAKISIDPIVAKIDMSLVWDASIDSWGSQSEFEQVDRSIRRNLPGLTHFIVVAAHENNVVVLSLD